MEVQSSTQNTYTSDTKSTNTEEVSPSGNFMNYLDKTNPSAFDNLTEDKETLYRSIMLNDSIEKSELEKLNYEQVKEFDEWLFKSLNEVFDGTKEGLKKIPAFGLELVASPMVAATQLTTDDNFNKAIFETMKNPRLSDNEKSTILREITQSISQSHFDKELSTPYVGGTFTGYMMPGESFVVNDYSGLLINILSVIEKGLDRPIDTTYKKQLEFLQESYKVIQEDYNKILDEEKSMLIEMTKNNRPNPIEDLK